MTDEIVSVKKGRGDEFQIRVKDSSNKKSDIVQRIDSKLDNVVIADNPLDRRSTSFGIKGIDMDVEVVDIVQAIRRMTGEDTLVKVSSLRIAYGETKQVTIQISARAAEMMADRDRVVVGWHSCRLELKREEQRCFRCWRAEHSTARCGGPDCTKMCFRCGRTDHQISACK